MKSDNYCGWKNYETWNISLWIKNDEVLYNIARECDDYIDFAERMARQGEEQTPDGVSWFDTSLCRSELNEMIGELERPKFKGFTTKEIK